MICSTNRTDSIQFHIRKFARDRFGNLGRMFHDPRVNGGRVKCFIPGITQPELSALQALLQEEFPRLNLTVSFLDCDPGYFLSKPVTVSYKHRELYADE